MPEDELERRVREARAAYAKVFGEDIDVQTLVEAFEKKVVDAICANDDTVEVPVEFAEAVAVLLKSVKRKPSHRGAPRTWWRDRITQAAVIDEARALKARFIEQGMSATDAEDRAARKLADKFKKLLKKFSAGTIKRRMQRRKHTDK